MVYCLLAGSTTRRTTSLARSLAGSLGETALGVTGDLGETTLGVALEFTSGHVFYMRDCDFLFPVQEKMMQGGVDKRNAAL